jgi:hypothetical protein
MTRDKLLRSFDSIFTPRSLLIFQLAARWKPENMQQWRNMPSPSYRNRASLVWEAMNVPRISIDHEIAFLLDR